MEYPVGVRRRITHPPTSYPSQPNENRGGGTSGLHMLRSTSVTLPPSHNVQPLRLSRVSTVALVPPNDDIASPQSQTSSEFHDIFQEVDNLRTIFTRNSSSSSLSTSDHLGDPDMTMCQSSGCVSTTSGSQYSEESIAPDVLDGPTVVDPGALSIRLVPKTTPSYPSTNEEGTADYEANRIHQNGITGVSHILDGSTAPQNGDPPMKLYPEPTQGLLPELALRGMEDYEGNTNPIRNGREWTGADHLHYSEFSRGETGEQRLEQPAVFTAPLASGPDPSLRNQGPIPLNSNFENDNTNEYTDPLKRTTFVTDTTKSLTGKSSGPSQLELELERSQNQMGCWATFVHFWSR